MPRIAIVEDNADNRLLFTALLEDAYAITEYADGTAALEGLRADPPDLVLLDISLPGMDGTEVLAALREDPSLAGLPVVALTAHALAGDKERFLEAGFDAYVSKPIIDDAPLFEAIERLLATRDPAR